MQQIFVHHDGRSEGPYSLEQVQACLIIGTLNATDPAWYEGLADKVPLSAAIAQLEQQGESDSDGWRRKVATADQKAELRFLGISVKRDLTQGVYQDLIDEGCKDPGFKLKLEVFRLKRTKEREFLEFLRKNSFKLGMMVPTMAQLRETLDFLQDSIPNWATETSPEEFAKLALVRYPDLKVNWESSTEQVEDAFSWDNEPATERQLAYLRDLGAHFSSGINKAEASELIERYKNQASDAQKRRLKFYGLNFDPNITKDEASELIDSYRERHPESEDAYQEWKITGGIPKSESSMPLPAAKQPKRWRKVPVISISFIVAMIISRIIVVSQNQKTSATPIRPAYEAQPTPSPIYEAQPSTSSSYGAEATSPTTSDNFIDEPQPLFGRIRQTEFAETGSGSIHLRPDDVVLVTARSSKYARIKVYGKTATLPLSKIDFVHAAPTRR